MRPALLLAVLLLGCGSAAAQAERYELGQRLKAFEKQWDKTTDEKLKKKAAEGLPKLTGLYFTGQFGEAGRTLDEARWILEGKQPSDDEKWAQSLYVVPATRFHSTGGGRFEMSIRAFYKVGAPPPKDLRVQIVLENVSGMLSVPIRELPAKAQLPIPERPRIRTMDTLLTAIALLGEKPIRKSEIGVTFDRAGKDRDIEIEPLGKAAAVTLKPGSIEHSTVLGRVELFKDLEKGTIFETDYPVLALQQELLQMMMLRQKEGLDYFTSARPGQFWLSIPTGKASTASRLFVPKGRAFIPKGEEPEPLIPLVVALHGAGGSENLFFEGYGDGQILKLCQKRGWMLVAPRIPLSLFGGGPPVAEIVDELAKRYPIDAKRVFIVGHSMGAMQAIDSVQKYPGKFAGLAAFGGDGRIRKPEPFAELPTFLGVGDKDFALKSVRALNKTLADGGAKAVMYKEYEGLEHMLICREALPDAFAMFDKLNVKK